MTHVIKKKGREIDKNKGKQNKKEVRKIVTIKDGMKTHNIKITKTENKEDCVENDTSMEGSIRMIHGDSYMLLTEGTHEIDNQDDTFWNGIVNNIRVRVGVRHKVTRHVEQEDQKHRECSKKAKIDKTI